MEHASRAEAVGTLVFMFEDHGLFKTPADLEALAAEVITVHADGSAEIICTPRELIRRAGELFPELREPAECVVPWCSGDRPLHAPFMPEEIEHTSHPDRLTIGGELDGWLMQTGDGLPVYALDMSENVRLTGPELRALAERLLERAGELDALTGEAHPEGVAR